MDLIQIKIAKDNNIFKYISLIRKFDPSLSISCIKQKIEAEDFALEFDLDYYDFVEELNGIDREKNFRSLISDLINSGAKLSIYSSGDITTLEFLDNWLNTRREIALEVEAEIELELK